MNERVDSDHIRILVEMTRYPIMTGILINMIRIYWFAHFSLDIFLNFSYSYKNKVLLISYKDIYLINWCFLYIYSTVIIQYLTDILYYTKRDMPCRILIVGSFD